MRADGAEVQHNAEHRKEEVFFLDVVTKILQSAKGWFWFVSFFFFHPLVCVLWKEKEWVSRNWEWLLPIKSQNVLICSLLLSVLNSQLNFLFEMSTLSGQTSEQQPCNVPDCIAARRCLPLPTFDTGNRGGDSVSCLGLIHIP